MKTTDKSRPSEKFVQHILSTVADPKADTDNIRAVIEAVWEKTQEQSGSPKTSDALVKEYLAGYKGLHSKVERLRDVIRNTLDKRQHEVPEMFKWAMGRRPLTPVIHGVYRKRTAFGTELTRITDSEAVIRPDDVIQLRGWATWDKGTVTNIPFFWLSLSDGEISKMVRSEVRRIASEKKRNELSNLNKKKKELERQLAALQTEIESAVDEAKKEGSKKA